MGFAEISATSTLFVVLIPPYLLVSVAVELSGNGQTTITLAIYMPICKTTGRVLTSSLSTVLLIKLLLLVVSMLMPFHLSSTMITAIFQVLLTQA